MLRTTIFTGLSAILQSLIDVKDKDKVGRSESSSNKTNLLNSSIVRKSIRAGYLNSKGAKNDGDNTKKGVKVFTGSDYLTLNTKMIFNQ